MTRTGVLLIALTILFCGGRADASPITYQYIQTNIVNFGGVSLSPVVVEASITVDGTSANFPSQFLNCSGGGPLCSYDDNGTTTTISLLNPPCPLNCQISPDFGNVLDFKLGLNGSVLIDLGSFGGLWAGKEWFISDGFITYNDTFTSFSMGIGYPGPGSINIGSEVPVAGGGCFNQRCFSSGEWVPTPEPGSMLLMASGLAALAARFHRWRPRRTAA
jgi:hypothetical protein